MLFLLEDVSDLEAKEKLSNAIQLVCTSNLQLSLFRRALACPFINIDIRKSITSLPIAHDSLFGESFQKSVEDAVKLQSSTSKLMPFSKPGFRSLQKEITKSDFMLNIVPQGYKIQFNSAPLPNYPVISRYKSTEQRIATMSEIDSMLKSGAISIVSPDSDHYVSRVFNVKKRQIEKNRLIIDLSTLNNFVNKVHFRMEGVQDSKKLVQERDYMISIDLSEAFFTILLHESSKKYVTFELNSIR